MDTMQHPSLLVGQRIRFCEARRPLTVRGVSSSGRFAVATRKGNRGQLEYTVLDFTEGVRGCDNHYGVGYTADEQVADALRRLEAGDIEVSYRHWVYLRYSDTQPDERTGAALEALRAHSLARHEARRASGHMRQNHPTRTAPWVTRDEA